MGKDNKGFSLIELIIVLALMALFSTVMIANVKTLHDIDVQNCAKNIKSLIDTSRQKAMTFKDASITIYKADGKVYGDVSTNKNGTVNTQTYECGGGNPDIEITFDTGVDVSLQDIDSFTINFDRSSGSFTASETEPQTQIGAVITSIKISRADMEEIITLNRFSGTVELEE